MLNINYDDAYDILYINFADSDITYSTEKTNGINVFRDIDDDSLTGLIIFDFIKKIRNGTLNKLPFSIKIDLEKNVSFTNI